MKIKKFILIAVVLSAVVVTLFVPNKSESLAGKYLGWNSVNSSNPQDVANGFLQVLQAKEWRKVANFFSSDFRRTHKKEILNGSLFEYTPGKNIMTVFDDPRNTAFDTKVRGNKAWAMVGIEHKSDRFEQYCMCEIELVKEGSDWKIMCFPPSMNAFCESRADNDGDAAGRWFQNMISDGDFSTQEQAQLKPMLSKYYIARIVIVHNAVVEQIHTCDEWSNMDIKSLMELTNRVDHYTDRKVLFISFWRNPTQEIKSKSSSLAKQAVQRLYNDLTAARDKYPELAKFDKEHVRFGDGGFSYQPNKPVKHQKIASPNIGFYVGEPYFGPTQDNYPRVIFPRQKLSVYKSIYVKDEKLRSFISQCIEKNIKPFSDYEKTLDSSPVREGW